VETTCRVLAWQQIRLAQAQAGSQPGAVTSHLAKARRRMVHSYHGRLAGLAEHFNRQHLPGNLLLEAVAQGR
jgi:hypothetical protein